MGFSAGGHVASTLGTHFEEANRPDFMALLYPVVTIKADYTHMGSSTKLLGEDPTDHLIKYYSNELQVTKNPPPAFIVTAEDDKAVPVENSIQLYLALKDKHVPAEMHLYPQGGHGFGMALQKGRLEGWSQLFIDWIKDI